MANQSQKTYELAVEARERIGKTSRKLAREGLVPGVVYGHNVAPESVQMPQREFDRVYLRAGSNSLVDLLIGGTVARKVFIHDVQRDPKSYSIRHVDFLEVNLREEITSNVPLVHRGESPLVAANEALLLTMLDHVQVRALPMELPSLIEVDLSGLDEIGKGITVADLTIPEGATLLTPVDELVVRVAERPVEEVIEPEVTEEELAEETEGEEAEEAAEGETAETETES